MAYFSTNEQLDRLWKLAFNKAQGDPSAQFYEELIPTVVDIHANDIPSDSIPSTPPGSTTAVVQRWIQGSGSGRISMTLDRKYNGNRVWVAKAAFESAFSSGSGDLTDILKNFISPKYGVQYVVKVYDGNNNEIPELFGDSSGGSDTGSWLFDYKAGVLMFQSDRTEGGSNSTDCIKIDVYQYIGRFVSDKADMVQGGVTGDIAVLDSDGNLVDSGYTVAEVQDKNYVYEQMVASSVWNVTHNLAKFPAVQVVDSGGTVCYGEVQYIDTNTVKLSFSASFAGVAYFN